MLLFENGTLVIIKATVDEGRPNQYGASLYEEKGPHMREDSPMKMEAENMASRYHILEEAKISFMVFRECMALVAT